VRWLIVASVVAIVGFFTASALPHPKTPPDDPWAALRRPLHLPSVATGERCPVTPARELSPAFGRGNGNGPVYPLVDRSLPFLYPVRRSQGWYPSKWSGQKVLWVAPPSFEGRVLVRGRRLDGRYLLRFGDRRRWPAGELRMTFGPERLGEGGWLEFGTYTRLRAAGCYAWQIDGQSFSEVVVFRAVRVR
jgi:hypothetical protein